MVLATVSRVRNQITAELSVIIDYCMYWLTGKRKVQQQPQKETEEIKVAPFLQN
jgi:hypothetical protein